MTAEDGEAPTAAFSVSCHCELRPNAPGKQPVVSEYILNYVQQSCTLSPVIEPALLGWSSSWRDDERQAQLELQLEMDERMDGSWMARFYFSLKPRALAR